MSQAQQMIKHSTIYAVGNISRQIVGFIMLPIYTHYLTPADYGVIGLLIFLVSLFEIILGGHMFQAVPKFYHNEKAAQDKNSVISTLLLVTMAFSALACLAMSGFSSSLSTLVFGDQKYSIFIIIFSALILTHALEQYGLTYLRVIKKPWIFLNFNMVKLGLQLSLNILLIVVLEMGLMGIAIASLASSTIIAIALMTYTLKRTGIKIKLPLAKKTIIFSWPLWVSGLIGLYIGSSNRYYIRVFSSLDDVGLFELAAKFGSIVSILIWVPFSLYWQTERFRIAQEPDPYKHYSFAFRAISALLTTSGLGVILFTPMIIELMSDKAFHAASTAVPYLVIAGILQCMTIFNNFSFMKNDKTFEVTKNNIFTALIITAFYFILIPKFGFNGASISVAIASTAQYFYALHRGNLIYPLKNRQAPLCVSLLILLATSLLFDLFVEPLMSYFSFSLRVIIFLLVAMAIVLTFFNREELNDAKNVIRK